VNISQLKLRSEKFDDDDDGDDDDDNNNNNNNRIILLLVSATYCFAIFKKCSLKEYYINAGTFSRLN